MEEGEVGAEEFALEHRRRESLESARAQLQARLSELQAQLSEEASRSYNDMSSITDSVADVRSASSRARIPLGRAKQRAMNARASASDALQRLQHGLWQRSDAAEARRLLELQQSALSAAAKVERLSPTNSSAEDASSNDLHAETQRLARASAEAHRLHSVLQQAGNLPLVQSVSERCSPHVHELSRRLTHAFPRSLRSGDWKSAEHCLGALASVSEHGQAEEAVRDELVQPAVKNALQSAQTSDATLATFLYECQHRCVDAVAPIVSMRNGDEFDFLGNSVIPAINDTAHSAFPDSFSPGRPDEFLQSYKAVRQLLDELDRTSVSSKASRKLRSSQATSKLLGSFDLALFSSLRFQEIVHPLEREIQPLGQNTDSSSLDEGPSHPPNLELSTDPVVMQPTQTGEECVKRVTDEDSDPANHENPDETEHTSRSMLESAAVKAAWSALKECWNRDKLVLELSRSMLRLSLQIMARLHSYVRCGVQASTGQWSSTESLSRLKVDLDDLAVLVESKLAPIVSEQIQGNAGQDAKAILIDACNECLRSASEKVATACAEKLAAEGGDHLRQMSGISATYRMANKPFPSRPSHFVRSVLQPAHSFAKQSGGRLPSEMRFAIAREAAELVTKRYASAAKELMQTVQRTESSLARLKRGSQVQQNSTNEHDETGSGSSYTEKVTEQMRLDIEEHSKHLVALRMDTNASAALDELRSVLRST